MLRVSETTDGYTKRLRINNADGSSASSAENFFKNLLNTVDSGGGIKTNVSVSLSRETIIYLGIMVFSAVLAVWVTQRILTELLLKK